MKQSAAAAPPRTPRSEAAGGRRLPARRRQWAWQLMRNTLLWLVPAAILWVLATPIYNRQLLHIASGVLHVVERPAVTDLLPKGNDDAYVVRKDFPPARALAYTFRVSDLHFHLILLAALFLGVPGIAWRERLGNLVIAAAVTVCYDILLVVFVVKFAYATQLGDWSLSHYGALARNFYGLGKHLLDLPFKLALPLLLWSVFYLPQMLQEPAETDAA
jgi:hypothetical protein